MAAQYDEPPASAAGRWFWDLGARATSASECVRVASALRAHCGGDRRCEEAVSWGPAYECYRGYYRVGAYDAAPDDPYPCRLESQVEVRRMCAALELPAEHREHCVAELTFGANELCRTGSPALTGAGP
jgi:hypothetical protein